MAQQSLEQRAQHLFEKVRDMYYQRTRLQLQLGIRTCAMDISGKADRLRQLPEFDNASLLRQFTNSAWNASVQIGQLSEGMEQPFTLFVMGMGKYGKSTLLNALLEQKAAEMDVLPKTWKIDVFEGSESMHTAFIKYRDGRIQVMPVDTCKAFLAEEEKKREQSSKTANEEFRKQAAELHTIEEKEELKKLLYDKMLYKSDVMEVRWLVPRNALLRHFRLVDTPGLVQNLIGEMKIGIQDYYHKADGVIWLLDATKISAQQSRQMLDELNESIAQIGGRTNNIIAVLNSIDKVRKTGGEAAVDSIVKEAHGLFGDLFQEIVPISAKEALDGIMSGDRALVEQSGIVRLQQIIQSRFLVKAQVIQTESKALGLWNVCHLFGQERSEYEDRLERDRLKFDTLADEFREAYQELSSKIKKDIKRFLDRYKSKVLPNIESRAERLFDFDQESEQKAYIESSIFDMNKLTGEELPQLQSKFADRIQAFYLYHSPKSVFREYEHLTVGQLSIVLRDQAASWLETGNIDLDTSGLSFASGTGMLVTAGFLLGPLGLILAGIASAFGLVKWIALKMKMPGIKKDLRSTLDSMIDKLEVELLAIVNAQLESIFNQVEEIRNRTYTLLHGQRNEKERIQAFLQELQETITDPVPKLHIKDVIHDLYREGKPA
ncbi:Dynamin family protein [Paenibacillus sp. yr247]|uniref:dynamin family protein n=1 Tax=Paenibacillus sp. yr247 TaxID=1761880 RepID=UPI000885E46C|nr:dynamin family protein [Paenibacillus sp. yr247]SDO87712.1 Dynamin family protein [Paenibacillus sp. yr247]